MGKNPNYTYSFAISEAMANLPLVNLSIEAQKILNNCRDYAPERTGNLRRSIHIEPYAFKRGYVELYIDTDYFYDKPPYYIYTNERDDVYCKGWWGKLCASFERDWKRLTPLFETKVKPYTRLTDKMIQSLEPKLIAAMVENETGAKLVVKEMPTGKELVEQRKELVRIRKEHRGKKIDGMPIEKAINTLIGKLSEQSLVRKGRYK